VRAPIRLGSSELAIVGSGVGTVLAVLWIAFMPQLEELYVRDSVLPRIADRYGFQFGMVQVRRDGESYLSPGIVSVSPDGAFARMGVRAGDLPFAFHGNGAATMNHALLAAEHGRTTEFEVVNADDWSAGRDRAAFRTIRVEPQAIGR
jgi:hypothetical protein